MVSNVASRAVGTVLTPCRIRVEIRGLERTLFDTRFELSESCWEFDIEKRVECCSRIERIPDPSFLIDTIWW